MKKIPWHNPAQQTPPEGYRLLIPEEVDGRFQNTPQRDNNVLVFSIRRHYWKPVNPLAGVDQLAVTYAVPSDTPLPEGYTLIDGAMWRMNGWTAHTPADVMYINSHIQADTVMEVMYRNGNQCTAPMKQHYFGQTEDREAEIIGWRIVADRDAGTGLHIPTDAIKAASSQLMGRIESFYRELMEENQKLKNQLADAQATLKSIRAILP